MSRFKYNTDYMPKPDIPAATRQQLRNCNFRNTIDGRFSCNACLNIASLPRHFCRIHHLIHEIKEPSQKVCDDLQLKTGVKTDDKTKNHK